jgi:diacylglycerol kinase (ATP)
MRARNIGESFRFAASGLLEVLRRHAHARAQFLLGSLVLIGGYAVGATPLQMAALVAAVALVILAETLNSAIEMAVNLASPEYSAMAKAAKDMAGAGVMVASTAAVAIGALVFTHTRLVQRTLGATLPARSGYVEAVIVGVIVVILLVAVVKAKWGGGTLLEGGAASLHSGVAVFLAVAIWYLGASVASGILGTILAGLVCQSRIQAGIHSIAEVIWGAGLALVLGTGLFQLLT